VTANSVVRVKRFLLVLLVIVAGSAWAVLSREPDSHSDQHPLPKGPVNDAEPQPAHSAPESAAVPVPSRVNASPPSVTAMPVAISSALPAVTLAGFLENNYKAIAQGKRWRGDPDEVKRSPGASQVAASKQFNPEGKQLSVDQERQLQGLIDSYDERSRPIHANERKATVEALARAAAAGQFESIELGVRPGMDAAALNRETEDGYRKIKEAQQRLADSFGRDGIDWAWAVAPSSEPDGVPRQNIVYFIRSNEAEVFRWREEERTITQERHRAYSRFFEQIR